MDDDCPLILTCGSIIVVWHLYSLLNQRLGNRNFDDFDLHPLSHRCHTNANNSVKLVVSNRLQRIHGRASIDIERLGRSSSKELTTSKEVHHDSNTRGVELVDSRTVLSINLLEQEVLCNLIELSSNRHEQTSVAEINPILIGASGTPTKYLNRTLVSTDDINATSVES